MSELKIEDLERAIDVVKNSDGPRWEELSTDNQVLFLMSEFRRLKKENAKLEAQVSLLKEALIDISSGPTMGSCCETMAEKALTKLEEMEKK